MLEKSRRTQLPPNGPRPSRISCGTKCNGTGTTDSTQGLAGDGYGVARVKEQLDLGLEDVPAAPRSGALRRFHANASTSPQDALAGERRAGRQEAAVLAFYGQRDALAPGCRFTPSQVWIALDELEWPLTSARRSLTNLTKAGLLTHHPNDKRLGLYGSSEGTWSLADAGRSASVTGLARSGKERQ